jgi:hypothetical protein
VLEAADELSAQPALNSKDGSADFLHVAAARRLHLLSGLDWFWTCDAEQAALAAWVDLKVRRFEPKRRQTQPLRSASRDSRIACLQSWGG